MMEDIVKFRDKTIRKNKVTIMNCKKKKVKIISHNERISWNWSNYKDQNKKKKATNPSYNDKNPKNPISWDII